MDELFRLSVKEGYKELAYRAQLRRVQYALQRLLGIQGEKDVKAGTSWMVTFRGYGGNVLDGRIATVPDVLKPYVKDGKINIEEFGKRLIGETN